MIIYEANETDFFSNGLGTLPDATSALVTEERNGEFVLDVIYPQQGIRSELLTKNRIIKADAGHELKDQRFVIKKVTPTMDSDGYIYLTVHAEHVSYITADLGVTPNLTLSGNATQALEQWQANLVGGHPDITVDSDIISEHETSLDITKATNARQVLGGVEGSILDTWGGEYKFDNLHISLRGQRGTTANTLISYGRNLLTFEQEDDITDTYTSIYPYANVGLADGNNSKLVTVDGYFVDSQYVDRYPNRKLLPVDFSSEFTDYKIGSKPSESDTGIYTTEVEIKKKLTELAKQYIENNRVGIPKVSTKITFADLSKTSEYAPLEQVNLCDIIPIRFEKLGIDTTIKVTRVVWNVLLDEYDSIELGDLRTTLGESISALESKTTGLANAVITAQSTADNQNSIFRTNGETAEPVAKKTGDLWFKTDGDYQYMYQWDGAVWHEVVNTKTTDDIAKEVDKAKADAKALSSEVESAKKQAQEAFAKAGFNADEIGNIKTATSEVTETLTSTVRQASELSESLKNVASETASRYSTVSSELSSARNSLNAKASELASKVASNSANITKANSQLYSQSEGLAKVSQSATKMEQTMTDLSGRVHTVETTAGETKEALADAKGNITTLTKRADGTDTKIADAQGRVQTLESRADTWDLELSKKVDNTTYNAGIQNLGNQINLKANKSDLDGYATKAQLSVESNRITQQASAISSVTTIANGANSKIDNLSFGGSNLLDNSSFAAIFDDSTGFHTKWYLVNSGYATWSFDSDVPFSAGDDRSLMVQVKSPGSDAARGIMYQSPIVKANTEYTISFWAKARANGMKIEVESNAKRTQFNLSTSWQRYEGVITFQSDNRALYIHNWQDGAVGQFLIFHPQLELGNKASDWSLSQNDAQKLASKDTASQINTFNTGTVQPIKGIANDALGKANSANDKIDGLRIGGRNLLKGTSDQFKTISNSGWMWTHTWTNNDNNTSKISLANFHTGDYLTYSAWVINDSDVDVTPEIMFFDKNLGNYTGTRGSILHPGQSGLVTNTRQIGSNDRYVRPSIISTNGQAGAHQIRIKEEMLTLGNVKLPWQPSDLDLPDTIITTVTTTTNAEQIVDNSGIYSKVTKLVDTKVSGVTTQLETYKRTVDDTGNKLRDVMGALKLDSNGKLTSNFNELIKTASGVEERYT
ncbi:phage tail spike protein, partial [Ligilactobacillus agilis]|uniref:phage tail spike protein n=1 Tax=Ligilactobacillus agilis TaxID=1601 RepID=UPI003F8B5FFE